MTYREYLEGCTDEFEKTIIISNLARKHPNYDRYSPSMKKRVQKELLDAEMLEEKDKPTKIYHVTRDTIEVDYV